MHRSQSIRFVMAMLAAKNRLAFIVAFERKLDYYTSRSMIGHYCSMTK